MDPMIAHITETPCMVSLQVQMYQTDITTVLVRSEKTWHPLYVDSNQPAPNRLGKQQNPVFTGRNDITII